MHSIIDNQNTLCVLLFLIPIWFRPFNLRTPSCLAKPQSAFTTVKYCTRKKRGQLYDSTRVPRGLRERTGTKDKSISTTCRSVLASIAASLLSKGNTGSHVLTSVLDVNSLLFHLFHIIVEECCDGMHISTLITKNMKKHFHVVL